MKPAHALLLAALLPAAHAAQPETGSWPARPIRVIAPFPAGSSVDAAMRLLSPHLAGSLGQTLVIDNRAGASGAIGSEIAARATPDGYTLLIATASTHAVAKVLNPHLSYDPQRDFMPVTLVGSLPYAITVHPAVPAGNLQELIALARAKPGEIRYSSAGNASLAHLAGEFFSSLANVRLTHVPYKSSALSVLDVIAGRIEMQFGAMTPVLPHIRAGRLRVLAVTSATRIPALPEVPTVREAGLAGFDVSLWMGIFLPARTPKALVDRLNHEFVAALRKPAVREGFVGLGVEPQPTTPAAFAAHIAAEIAKWGKVVKTSGIRTD